MQYDITFQLCCTLFTPCIIESALSFGSTPCKHTKKKTRTYKVCHCLLIFFFHLICWDETSCFIFKPSFVLRKLFQQSQSIIPSVSLLAAADQCIVAHQIQSQLWSRKKLPGRKPSTYPSHKILRIHTWHFVRFIHLFVKIVVVRKLILFTFEFELVQ